jgi:hypothetical protein
MVAAKVGVFSLGDISAALCSSPELPGKAATVAARPWTKDLRVFRSIAGLKVSTVKVILIGSLRGVVKAFTCSAFPLSWPADRVIE